MSTAFKHVKLPASQGTSNGGPGLLALMNQDPNDIVITLAIRSPLCKARKGGFKDTRYAIAVFR
jgi:acetyl-CoA acyltransferase 1